MKVAICFTGHFRTYDKHHAEWKRHIYDQYDCDIFMHTWDIVGTKKHPEWPGSARYHVYDTTQTLPYTLAMFQNDFKFTKVQIEKYYPEMYNRFYQETQYLAHTRSYMMPYDPHCNDMSSQSHEIYIAIYSMWYSKWKAFELMKLHAMLNNIQYDMVISIRPDNYIVSNLHALPRDLLTLPYLGWGHGHNRDVLEDRWAIGPMHLVQEYSNIYNRLTPLIPRWKFGTHELLNSPYFLDKYIHELHIPYHKLDLNSNPYVITHKTM